MPAGASHQSKVGVAVVQFVVDCEEAQEEGAFKRVVLEGQVVIARLGERFHSRKHRVA